MTINYTNCFIPLLPEMVTVTLTGAEQEKYRLTLCLFVILAITALFTVILLAMSYFNRCRINELTSSINNRQADFEIKDYFLVAKDAQGAVVTPFSAEKKGEIIEMTDVVKRIRNLKNVSELERLHSRCDFLLDDDDLRELCRIVDYVSENRLSVIADTYRLSFTDMALICLIFLDVDTRDASLLLGIKESTLSKRKWRLKTEKLGLSAETDFDDWISDNLN